MKCFVIVILVLLQTVPGWCMWPESSLIGESCYQTAKYNFDACISEDFECLCNDYNYMSTVAYCIDKHAQSAADRDSAWDYFTDAACKLKVAAFSDKIYDRAQDYLKRHKATAAPALSHSHDPKDAPTVDKPVYVDEKVYMAMYYSTENFLFQKDLSVYLGCIIILWWLCVIAWSCITRLWIYMSWRFVGSEAALCRPTALGLWWQKHVLMPACFGFRHMVKIKFAGIYMTIPLRSEVLVIGVYFILNVVFDVAPYIFLENDLLYPTRWKAMMRFASDRSGIIGVIHLPLLTLFALRNNPLIWMTGWSFAEFNTYHRAIARVTYLQFIVHSITKHIFAASYGASLVKYFYPLPYYRWGVAAMFLMAIMIGTGWFRDRIYSLFLQLHILCATTAYVCVLYHLKGLGYKQTVYVSFGLWAGDSLVRLGRIFFLNFALFMAPKHGSRYSRAKLFHINKDVVNIRIRTTVVWKPKPGQYIFIHLQRRRFWESHPFSVVGPSGDGESFQLVCKARGGMTKRFCDYLAEHGSDEKQPLERAVVVEGPYGLQCPVERYSEILLVAGGIGITGVLPYVEYLISEKRLQNCRVWFIWIIQKSQDCRWIDDRIDDIASKGCIRMDVYASNKQRQSKHFTLQESQPSAISLLSKTSALDTKEDLEFSTDYGVLPWNTAHMHNTRPNTRRIIKEFLSTAQGSACIVACGPPSLMDSTREKTCQYLDANKRGRVDYFEEAFSW